jgi:hypothetical protein
MFSTSFLDRQTRSTTSSMTHSLTFLFPLNKTVLLPVGALKASWSKVKASPPLAMILSLADRAKLKAATVSLPTSGRRSSSRTFPTTTTVLAPY